MLELAGDAERRGQVEMADPEAVDAVERGDRVGVLDAGPGLDLGEEGRARIGGGELVQHGAAPVEVVRHAQRHAALAVGHVFHAVEDVPRLLGVVDHRQHDAFGTHVGGAGDVMVLLRRHPADHRQPRGLEVADDALDGLVVEARMLGVEQDEIAAGILEQVADAGRRELDDEVPDLELAALGLLLEGVSGHDCSP